MAGLGALLFLGALGAVGLAASSRKKGSEVAPGTPGQQPAPGTPPPPVVDTPDAPANTVKAPSGRTWVAKMAKRAGDDVFVDVYAPGGDTVGAADLPIKGLFTPGDKVLRFRQTGSDKGSRIYIAHPPQTHDLVLKAAMTDFGVKRAAAAAPDPEPAHPKPTTLPGETPGAAMVKSPGWPPMTAEQNGKLAHALKVLTVGVDGKIIGPITEQAVQVATQIAGQLEAAGLKAAADKLREYIRAASAQIPAPPPDQSVVIPGITPALQAQIDRAIQLQRDPAALQVLVDALTKLPPTKETAIAIEMLNALIAQVEAQQVKTEALAKVETEVAMINPALQAGANMANSLIATQLKYGGAPQAKGKEDKPRVMAFQKAVGLKGDGLAGPGTLMTAAKLGVGKLPLVMYWPKGANLNSVRQYRGLLMKLSEDMRSHGNVSVADMLKHSAERERGQGGVSGGLLDAPAQAPATPSPQIVLDTPSAIPAVVAPTAAPATPAPGTVPIPQAAPVAKTAVQIAASNMAVHLKQIQRARGGAKQAKGHEDTNIIKRFQKADGQKQDGLPGPGTLLASARHGVSILPFVMYWPKSATKTRVLRYRSDLNALAQQATAAGDTVRASQLSKSAARERGQAGIVGPMPPAGSS